MPVKCERDYVHVRITKKIAAELLRVGARHRRNSVNLEANIAAEEYAAKHLKGNK